MSEYKDKYQLFEYFKSVKNPNLCRESVFQKRFEDIYADFKNSIFYSLDFSFKERLYLYFIDDYELTSFKCKCGNKKRFHTFATGYYPFCCHTCAANDEDVRKRTKETFESFSEDYINDINRRKSETLKSYYENASDDVKEFLSKRCYNNFHSSLEKENELNEKRQQTRSQWSEDEKKQHHNNFLNGQLNRSKESWENSIKKSLNTKKKNKTTSSSKLEESFENYLINSNIYFEKQYMSKLYPFACDFYIVDKNLYVEIQGNWTHGPHPFDKNNKEDISILNNWKEKNTPYYLSAIKNWTINDPHKREVAKNNKLNFLEIFTQDVNDLIKKFNDYYEQL